MAEQEPTVWELMRLLTAVQTTLSRMEGRMLTVEVFSVHQEGIDRRFIASEQDLTEWKAESRGAHVELDSKILKNRERQDVFEERLRTDKQKWMLTGVTAAAGLVISVVSGVFLFFLNGGAG